MRPDSEHRTGDRDGTRASARARRRTRARTRARAAGLLAAALVGGLLVTGCGGGSDGSSADHGKARRAGPLPAPAPARPSAPATPVPGTDADGEQRDIAPTGTPSPTPADYLSTFALDVDTASYGYARRTLADGRLPDPKTVRPEEFINSFRQDYPRPEGNGFSVTADGARAGAEGWSFLRVGLATGPASPASRRPPAALTFVIDVSGSMSETGRLDLVKQSLGVMTDRLRPDDSLALVTFSDTAETVLPMTRVGDGRGRVHDAIDGLEPRSSTNLDAGVRTGYDTAVEGARPGATNRVVLLSDALANTGETDADAILDRISDARREHGITLFGVGVGSEYGDALMERLADKGDGHTTYVSTPEEARKVFCDELPQNIELRAREAKAQVAFDPQTVQRFRLIGYDDRQVADDDYRNDRVDGGEVGPGHTVTALYAIRLRPGASGHVATAGVRWLDPDTRAPHEQTTQIEASALDTDVWRANRGLRLTATAAYFADALRQGALPGAPTLPQLAAHADKLARAAEDKDVRKLAEAIRRADDLRT
ncbi:von Willebrand factor type A domain-containing protein [Streptomyces sp. NPDC056002]|uniref:vWA domain-containing protein n=1 Tax=unclassified Streptomyces TaxID=2593676 RepID=UPI0035DB4662